MRKMAAMAAIFNSVNLKCTILRSIHYSGKEYGLYGHRTDVMQRKYLQADKILFNVIYTLIEYAIIILSN